MEKTSSIVDLNLSEETKNRINRAINNPITVAEEIYLKTLQLGKARRLLEIQAEKKAKARSEWKKQRAIKMLELRNLKKGEEILWEGKKVTDIPATLIKSIAEGMVNDYEEKMCLEEDTYDFIKTMCYNLSAEMNGLQSINKYMTDLPDKGEQYDNGKGYKG